MFQGRFEEAGELAEYILANDRDRNDKWALGMILMLLSSVKLFTGKPDEAIAPPSEAIELFTTIGDPDRLLQAKGTKARSLVECRAHRRSDRTAQGQFDTSTGR